VKNFVEDMAATDFKATGKHVLGFGEAFSANSTQRTSFTPYGKTGDDLMYFSQRHDRELSNFGLKGDVLFRHGDFKQDPVKCHATLNSLTHGEKHLGEPRVQTYLWTGSNRLNQTVPLSTQTLSLTQRKAKEWEEAADPSSSFRTTTRSALYSSALPAAEQPVKRDTIKPMADGGQLAQVGRKPVGGHAEECEKNYRRIGLRDTYCTFLTTAKH